MQLKTTVRYYVTCDMDGWLLFRKTGTHNCQWGDGSKIVGQFRNGISKSCRNLTPREYPREMKTYIYAKTCTQMFLARLFIVAKKCKQPTCSWTDKWINKLCYIHTVDYYSVVKEWSASTHYDMDECWKHEMSQLQKPTYHVIALLGNVPNRQILETESRPVVTWS